MSSPLPQDSAPDGDRCAADDQLVELLEKAMQMVEETATLDLPLAQEDEQPGGGGGGASPSP